MTDGRDFGGRRGSGGLPKPGVPPGFAERLGLGGTQDSGEPRGDSWGGQQAPRWQPGASYPGNGQQGQHGQQAGADGDSRSPGWGHDQRGQGAYAPGQYPPPGPQGFGQPFPQQPSFGPSQPPRPPQLPLRGKSWPARHKGLTGLFAFVGLIIIVVAANSGGSSSSSSGGTAAGAQPVAAAPAAPAASHPAAAAPTVTYEVTGSAAADVTYGPAGSTLSGTVPMKVSAKLGSPIYCSLTAQLQGGGSVRVKILVNGVVISQGMANGGFNIATAEISQDPFSGRWTDVNNG
ncbi:MAG: hypothetical protein ACRDOI_00435 [Trebonia sp.]